MTDCQSCKPEPPPRPSLSESWSIRGTVTHGTVRRSDRPGRRRAAGAVSPASASYCCSASLSEFSGTGCARSVHRQRRHEIPLTLLVPDAVRVKSTSRTRKAAASNPNARRSTDSELTAGVGPPRTGPPRWLHIIKPELRWLPLQRHCNPPGPLPAATWSDARCLPCPCSPAQPEMLRIVALISGL